MSATTAIQRQAPPQASPLRNLAARFSIDPAKLLNTLRGTIIKPDKNGRAATDDELAAFCIVADQYGLNPFTKEIYAFPAGDKGIVPMIGVDGWVKLVNSQEKFDGVEFEEVGCEDGSPSQITCKMHVKGREHPVVVTERFAECKRNTIPWNTMPWRMLRHKAYMQAARYAFGLAGIYDEDEAADIARNVMPERVPVSMPRAIGGLSPASGNGSHGDASEQANGADDMDAPASDEVRSDLDESLRQLQASGSLSEKELKAVLKQAGLKTVADLKSMTAAQANTLGQRLGQLQGQQSNE